MIFSTQANTTQMELSFMAGKRDVGSLPPIVTPRTLDFNFCLYECCYEELVFGKTGGQDFEQDERSFLERLLQPADTAIFKLFKNNVEIATLNDDTLGTFTDVGGFAAQPLYTEFIIDFTKVLAIHGVGLYRIETETSILGELATKVSHNYRLFPYDFRIADRTVKLTTIQDGNIESSQFDYTGINRTQSIRIKGKFFKKTPSFNTDNTLTTSRVKTQIQDSIENTYTLEMGLLPSGVANQIIYDNFLANRIFITDYNIWNEQVYTNIEVYPDEFEQPQDFTRSTRRTFEFRFTDKQPNILKRN